MQQLKNPFYVLLMVVGVVFTITMCAYCVMTLSLARPSDAEAPPSPMIDFLARHGLTLVVGELIVLALLTVLAIATDEYFTAEPGREAGELPPSRGAAASSDEAAPH